ncbi:MULTISPECIES: Cof-type HAD-IIB family hydrolase [unclassified Enterococcus]|uniref:Cof-type HAD-IIB family hydrolase n=1 Tax=unclassified Enterococcus TaxID=2608891 RepID=UPI0015539136|nr:MULTISPECIES: Cof-type HAD-IIB family hydrolase [unclassified Enterococcus]MBS7577528.1 Cof-type HAD-IIB family hydrolase [Enterococcus sp. MMGLQ5-2]MBS7584973.1 Cof-type HAD-IIB family hydrolase [Enterococcus sp. MMGLQ5-1]NPD12828.1 Cof-type HAD-IIB family hydrolase [Enterococcus sp. MMGLQ5-1]NPD37361.1 Cof-type HAD-IIB family hydrolase [Enterococcus sp. MMGLQ5-2]
MKPKAICFFDLDGTLLNEHSKVDQNVAQTILQLKKNNVLPVIASGRSTFEVRDIMAESGINSMIAMNGQLIEIEGQVLFDAVIPASIAKGFISIAEKKQQEIVFYNEAEFWTKQHSETMAKAYQSINQHLPAIEDQIDKLNHINLLLIILKDDDSYLAYQEAFPELTFFRNNPNIVDVVLGENNKGTGVKQTLKLMKLQVPTFAFGDGPNDFDLFEACDHKIAMGNAVEGLKNIADFVTKTNLDGGIQYALKHYQLL